MVVAGGIHYHYEVSLECIHLIERVKGILFYCVYWSQTVKKPVT